MDMTIVEISSLIAIVTVITGTITGIVSLCKVSKIKKLDLRIEKDRIESDIALMFEDLSELSVDANKSRVARLSAQGLYNSGNRIKWEEFYKSRTEKIHKLSKDFDIRKNKPYLNSDSTLEYQLSELYKIKINVKSIIDDFNKSIKEDDIERENLRSEKFQHFNATIKSGANA